MSKISNDTPVVSTAVTVDSFPGAQIVGGAILLDGKNMGVITTSGEVETSAYGLAYLNAVETTPVTTALPTEVPNPIPPGVLNPAEHTPVSATAKRAVRTRKQNEAVVEGMNAPTAEEETNFKAADDAAAAPPVPDDAS